MRDARQRALDSLDGLSVGDALGQRFFFPEVAAGASLDELPEPPWWWTDDTNMALSVVDQLLADGAIDQDRLAASFSVRFDAGRQYGPAMNGLLPALELEDWRFAAAQLFGGTGSFGNGAAMRIAPLGAYLAEDLDAVVDAAERTSVVTHTHPEASAGAIAVAVAAALSAGGSESDPGVILDEIIGRVPDGEVRAGLVRVGQLGFRAKPYVIAAEVGNGSRVSAQDTCPFAVWCALKHLDDYRSGVWEAISAGGDMDTTAAMAGGIIAARLGRQGIPPDWLAAREPLPAWHLSP